MIVVENNICTSSKKRDMKHLHTTDSSCNQMIWICHTMYPLY